MKSKSKWTALANSRWLLREIQKNVKQSAKQLTQLHGVLVEIEKSTKQTQAALKAWKKRRMAKTKKSA